MITSIYNLKITLTHSCNVLMVTSPYQARSGDTNNTLNYCFSLTSVFVLVDNNPSIDPLPHEFRFPSIRDT